jgi:hypothetical protein
MSIPLVQNNEKDSINTSIIAIKRQIERINTLLGLSNSEEIDTSVFATKDELQQAVTDLQPVDEVTADNMHSVTSNAVAVAIGKNSPDYANKVLITNTTSRYSANYTAPKNGFITGSGWGTNSQNNFLYFNTSNGVFIGMQATSTETISVTIPVRKGDVVTIQMQFADINKGLFFIPCE